MRNKTISITEELYDLLKLEENASDLITRVVWDYYNSIKPKEEIKPEIIDPITTMEKSILMKKLQDETDELNAMFPDEDEI